MSGETNYKRLKVRFKSFAEKYKFDSEYYNESSDVLYRRYFISPDSTIRFSLTQYGKIKIEFRHVEKIVDLETTKMFLKNSLTNDIDSEFDRMESAIDIDTVVKEFEHNCIDDDMNAKRLEIDSECQKLNTEVDSYINGVKDSIEYAKVVKLRKQLEKAEKKLQDTINNNTVDTFIQRDEAVKRKSTHYRVRYYQHLNCQDETYRNTDDYILFYDKINDSRNKLSKQANIPTTDNLERLYLLKHGII